MSTIVSTGSADTVSGGVGCGNGILDSGEQCDPALASSISCVPLATEYAPGAAVCTAGCEWNTTDCQTSGVCGNNLIDGVETCDDGNVLDGDGCSSNCVSEAFDDFDCGAIVDGIIGSVDYIGEDDSECNDADSTYVPAPLDPIRVVFHVLQNTKNEAAVT